MAQLDRATDYESVGREFESLLAHQEFQGLMTLVISPFFVNDVECDLSLLLLFQAVEARM